MSNDALKICSVVQDERFSAAVRDPRLAVKLLN